MPLTFAHPAAVLPFSRKSKYIHFSALVLGSMAPDFEYFLRGRPIGEIGHTFVGFFLFNLPLVLFIYLIYQRFIQQPIMSHLPEFLQATESICFWLLCIAGHVNTCHMGFIYTSKWAYGDKTSSSYSNIYFLWLSNTDL